MFLIGDVHGKIEEYLKIVKSAPSSIQLGDMGFDYSFFNPHLTSDYMKLRNHRFFFGNHDDPHKAYLCKNHLGRYGVGYDSGKNFFFVGGAYSIDKSRRIEGRDWFREEELNYQEQNSCVDLYSSIGGRDREIILSHDCPQFLVDDLWGYPPTSTRKLLDFLYKIHRPKLWVFGHHHKSIDVVVDGTRFICLNELETLEI